MIQGRFRQSLVRHDTAVVFNHDLPAVELQLVEQFLDADALSAICVVCR